MNIFNNIKKTADTIAQECETETVEPVSYEEMEKVVKLLTTACEIQTKFVLELFLSIGTFRVDADSFKTIKLSKGNKTQGDRIIISFADALSSTETTIELENIEKVVVEVNYTNKEDYE